MDSIFRNPTLKVRSSFIEQGSLFQWDTTVSSGHVQNISWGCQSAAQYGSPRTFWYTSTASNNIEWVSTADIVTRVGNAVDQLL